MDSLLYCENTHDMESLICHVLERMDFYVIWKPSTSVVFLRCSCVNSFFSFSVFFEALFNESWFFQLLSGPSLFVLFVAESFRVDFRRVRLVHSPSSTWQATRTFKSLLPCAFSALYRFSFINWYYQLISVATLTIFGNIDVLCGALVTFCWVLPIYRDEFWYENTMSFTKFFWCQSQIEKLTKEQLPKRQVQILKRLRLRILVNFLNIALTLSLNRLNPATELKELKRRVQWFEETTQLYIMYCKGRWCIKLLMKLKIEFPFRKTLSF